MGFATTICRDKTITLTMNQMTVVKAYVAGKIREPPNSSESLLSVVQSLLIEGIAHNTIKSIFKPKVKCYNLFKHTSPNRNSWRSKKCLNSILLIFYCIVNIKQLF